MSDSNRPELILSNLLTVIVTTSPVPSCPSADLIKNNLRSLPSSMSSVPIIITFDNFNIISHGAERLKKGYVSQEIANQYPLYIRNVCKLFGDVSSELDQPDCLKSQSLQSNVTFLVLKQRNGFAFSVKIALDYVNTPYVMILQHDWLFINHPPMFDLLSILQTEVQVKYIVFVARWSINYETSKGESNKYYRYIFKQARALRQNYPLESDLVACLHWFDRPHLCSVETYQMVFASGIVKRGDFIEDTFGVHYLQRIRNANDRESAFKEWKTWGAWMYYPDDGTWPLVRHQHGRVNLLGEQQDEKIKNLIKISEQCVPLKEKCTEKVNRENTEYDQMLKDFFDQE